MNSLLSIHFPPTTCYYYYYLIIIVTIKHLRGSKATENYLLFLSSMGMPLGVKPLFVWINFDPNAAELMIMLTKPNPFLFYSILFYSILFRLLFHPCVPAASSTTSLEPSLPTTTHKFNSILLLLLFVWEWQKRKRGGGAWVEIDSKKEC